MKSKFFGTLTAVGLLAASGFATPVLADDVIVGLITKTNTNPFFVKMREGAQEKADELGVDLSEVARRNLDKLKARADRGRINGEGSDR